MLFRTLATVALDVPVGVVDDWQWLGPTEAFTATCERLGSGALVARAQRAAGI